MLTILLYVLGQLDRDVRVASVVMLGAFLLDSGLSRSGLPESRLRSLGANSILRLAALGRRLGSSSALTSWELIVPHLTPPEPALDLLAVQDQLCVHSRVHVPVPSDVLGVHSGSHLEFKLD